MPAGRSLSKWTPRHERVMYLHLQGKSNLEISKEVDYSTSYVSTIINSMEGQRIVRTASRRVREAMQEEIEGMITEMKRTSLKRVKETIDAEFHTASDEKKHQDKISMDFLKSSNTLKPDGPEGETLEKVGAGVIRMLAQAIEKSEGAGNELSGMMGDTAGEIEEGEFELLEDGEDD